jgi:hypothetical protein
VTELRKVGVGLRLGIPQSGGLRLILVMILHSLHIPAGGVNAESRGKVYSLVAAVDQTAATRQILILSR